MARIRNIKPDYFTDAELADLSPLHRLLFPALWCQADRDGRLEDKPRELKVKCLPYDDCDVDRLLADLHAAGFIVRYEADGRRYIAIRGFGEHQRFHKDEKPAGFPAPPEPTQRGATDSAMPLPTAAMPLSDEGVSPPKPRLVSDVGDGRLVSGTEAEPPPTPPAGDIEFFVWAQERRSELRPGLIPESPNAAYPEFFARAMRRLDGDVGRLQAAWRWWLRDDFGAKRDPPFAMRVFQSDEVWVKHVPELTPKARPRPPRNSRPLPPLDEEISF